MNMKIGDVVLYENRRWKIVSHNRDFRTSVIADFDGNKIEVPDDLDQGELLSVLFNPSESWPFTSVPVKAKAGPLRRVTRGDLALRPMADWIPSDFLRPGGAIFFNPVLRLRTGEILVATHQDGTLSRITITKGFGTVRRKVARAEKKNAPKPQQMSVYDRLMAGDIFDRKDSK
jgi:hypothetical protein